MHNTLEMIFGQNNELFNLKFKIMVKLNKRIFGILILCMFLSVAEFNLQMQLNSD